MTVSLYPDERKAIFWVLSKAPVSGVVDVDINGVWYPASLNTDDPHAVLVGVLICGADLDPTPVGHIVIPYDTLGRVRADGEIHTDEWIRVPPR